MTSPARAPRPTPRRRPVAERPRPDLRVVGPPTRAARTGIWVILAATVVFTALFVAAASHSMVVKGQVHLDDVGRQVRAGQQLLQKERVRLANDQSPARITREAARLGMVPADEQNWVSPAAGTAPVVTGPDAPPTSVPDDADSSVPVDELAAGTDPEGATDR